MLHFFLYADSPSTKRIIQDYKSIIKNRKLLEEFIVESLLIKKGVIEVDEFDKGERNKFNYGHTFGHAIETVTNYEINHGQAVTIGMDLANYISVKLGLLVRSTFDEYHALLKVNFPDFNFNDMDIEEYSKSLSRDKKNIGDNVGCILTKGNGNLIKMQVPLDNNLLSEIQRYFHEEYSK